MLPVRLQAVPQTVVIVADSQTQLLPLCHPALLWQEVHTLHPVVPPLKHTTALVRGGGGGWTGARLGASEHCVLELTGAIFGSGYVQLGAMVHTMLPLGSMSRSHQDRTT